MKKQFVYSEDFNSINAKELSGCCLHLICTEGEGSFVFNEKRFHIGKNDLAVIVNPNRISNVEVSKTIKVEWFAAGNKFLNGLLPANNYSIGGDISLNNDPPCHPAFGGERPPLFGRHPPHSRADERHRLPIL